MPLDLVAKDLEEDRIQLSASDTPICKSSSSSEVCFFTIYASLVMFLLFHERISLVVFTDYGPTGCIIQ